MFDKNVHQMQSEFLACEKEIARLTALVDKLQYQIAAREKLNVHRSKPYHEFESILKFNRFIQDRIITLSHDEDEGILILWDSMETEQELEKRLNGLQVRLDRIVNHYLPLNKKQLAEIADKLK